MGTELHLEDRVRRMGTRRTVLGLRLELEEVRRSVHRSRDTEVRREAHRPQELVAGQDHLSGEVHRAGCLGRLQAKPIRMDAARLLVECLLDQYLSDLGSCKAQIWVVDRRQ